MAMVAFGANAASAAPSKTLLPAYTCTNQCNPPPSATSAPSPAYGGRWGERVVATGADYNGDGINDVWVADPFADVGSTVQAGRVDLVSGASLINTTTVPQQVAAPLYTLTAPTPVQYGHFGFTIANIGNVGGFSTKPDLAVGVDTDLNSNGTGATGTGNVWVYDGDMNATTRLLYTINSPTGVSGERFGSRITAAGDVYNTASVAFRTKGIGGIAGDGKSEIIVGASNQTFGGTAGRGRAYLFDGNAAATSHAAIRTYDPPNVSAGSFGLSVQGPGDVNGDGIPDQVVAAPAATVGANTTAGEVYVYDGAGGGLSTATPVHTIQDPTAQTGSYFGFQDVTPNSPGDVNGDAKADIYVDGWLQNVGPNAAQGEAWVFDGTVTGTTNTPLRTMNDSRPHANGQFGWSMTKTLKGSSTTAEMLIGASPHHSSTSNEDGGAGLYLTSTGASDLELPLPQEYQQGTTSTDPGPNLGWTVASPGPLKAGSTDLTYLAGAPFVDNNSPANQDEGLIFAFWGPTYAHAYCPPNSDGSPTGTCT